MSPKRAIGWVAFWVTLALLVSVGLFKFRGTQVGVEFLTCYAIEWSLSLDNLFVFLMIFNAFSVPNHSQLRVLEWGIIGAIVMRLSFILVGLTLVQLFQPILYLFGALLLYSAYEMAFKSGARDVTQNWFVRKVSRKFPVTDGFIGEKFFVRRNGVLYATPLVLVLVAIESSDVLFALDSIPAAFAITHNPWIIFWANLFAILGLRSLYFLIAHADRMFRYLKHGVAVILAFVGVKIILAQVHFHISPTLSLTVVMSCLAGSIGLSILMKNHRIRRQYESAGIVNDKSYNDN